MRIQVFDTTLRDGEQSPGVSLTPEEKIQIAHQLARAGVDVIEAGFPAASDGDFAGVQRIAREVRGPVIAGLARANANDIQRCFDAIKDAAKPRVHTFIATSPIHMQYKLRKSPDEVVKIVAEQVAFAASLGAAVEFSAEDATRSDWRFLARVFTVATRSGATILNVPDTVGYTTPKEYYELIEYLKKNVEAPGEITFSVHCHNDLGLAAANTLAALEAGAGQVEGTFNGIGERAGNVALEEIVMALRTRSDRYPFTTGIVTTEIARTSKLISNLTGMVVQPNKAIVGANAFAHESGIHQDGVLKERTTYEIMSPEDVGLTESNLVLGKHSGRHAFRDRLEKLGHQLSAEDLDRAFIRFKELADRKRGISDRDLDAIVGEQQATPAAAVVTLEAFQVVSGNQSVPTASVRVQRDGGSRQEAASGDGPVDALFRAIDRASDFLGELLDYQLRAVTEGQDAVGEVTVKVESKGYVATGRGTSTDVLEASARAYVTAMNKLMSGEGARLVGDQQPAHRWAQRVWGD